MQHQSLVHAKIVHNKVALAAGDRIAVADKTVAADATEVAVALVGPVTAALVERIARNKARVATEIVRLMRKVAADDVEDAAAVVAAAVVAVETPAAAEAVAPAPKASAHATISTLINIS